MVRRIDRLNRSNQQIDPTRRSTPMARLPIPILLALASSHAMATTALVPEPDALGLLAAGAVAGLVVWIRKRRR